MKRMIKNTKIFSLTTTLNRKSYIALFVASIENFKNLKYHTFGKTLILFIIWSKCENEDEKIFKEEESIEMLKIVRLFKNI